MVSITTNNHFNLSLKLEKQTKITFTVMFIQWGNAFWRIYEKCEACILVKALKIIALNKVCVIRAIKLYNGWIIVIGKKKTSDYESN